MLNSNYFALPAAGVVLFDARHCLHSQQVRFALAEKRVAWTRRPLDVDAGEHFSPDYIRINPQMSVPTLADRGRVIVKASRIIRYIDLRFDGPMLCPDRADLARRVERGIVLADQAADVLNSGLLSARSADRKRATWRAQHAILDLKANENADDLPLVALYRRKQGELTRSIEALGRDSQVAAARAKIEHVLDQLETELADGLLGGAGCSLADISWAPVLHRLFGCNSAGIAGIIRNAKVERYLARLVALPNFDVAEC